MTPPSRQYGNSIRFRMLKWLQPIAMTLLLAICWHFFYIPERSIFDSFKPHALILVAYLVSLYCLNKTYHALAVGLVRISEMVYSQTLGALICNAVFYFYACVYCHDILPLLPFILLIAVQFVFCVLWSITANRIYFAFFPPPKTAIIHENDSDLMRIASIRYFSEHFDLVKTIRDPGSDAKALFAQLEGIQVLFISGVDYPMRSALVKYCVENNIRGYFVPCLSEIIMAGAEHMSMFSEPVMRVQRAQTKSFYLGVKRLLDMVIAAVGIVCASPVMLITALAIKLYDGGPVFYRQKRLTQNRRIFSILKFRSMNVNAEKDGVARLASENDSRITPVGKFIRATRIDELPQLINILRGDMSLVGPRPERPEIAAEYEKELPEFSLRLQVKAGLTGVAQVYGRYNTEPYSKLQMDLMYINKISLITDFKLLFATVKILFLKESTSGIQEGMTTAANPQLNDVKNIPQKKRSA